MAGGSAIYDRERFSVEDGSKTDFDKGTLLAANTPIAGAAIFGMGYGIHAGKSSYPVREYILEDEAFAVHDDVPDPMAPTGLLWAYVHGTRQGHPYHYWAKLPKLVTDVVSDCVGEPDSYYRLPWKAGTVEKVTQGNATGSSHKGSQKFAFDFVMPKYSVGRAPRGGVVTFVDESKTQNSNPDEGDPWLPGNVLQIQHQDGTFSWYEHMLPGIGVLPAKDDIVERGDQVIQVGNTGNSTGPHLHYHVTKVAGGDTIGIRFEVAFPLPPFDPIACHVPGKGALGSTNAKPTS